MPRIALYTAITGGYERTAEIFSPAGFSDTPVSATDFFRFIDADADADAGTAHVDDRGHGWREVRVRPRVPLDSIRSARALKILGHPLLSEHDVTVWVDNRVQLKVSPAELVERFLPADSDIAAPLHSFRESLADEFDEILRGRVDDPRRVREQRSVYSELNPAVLTKRIPWTAILIRRNNAIVRNFNAAWWEQVLRYSRRDQLSFTFARDLLPDIDVSFFELNNFESDVHEWRSSSDISRLPLGGLWNLEGLSSDDLNGELSDLSRILKEKIRRSWSMRNRR